MLAKFSLVFVLLAISLAFVCSDSNSSYEEAAADKLLDALDDLNSTQINKLKQAVQQHANESMAKQEEQLLKAAEQQGKEVKKAVQEALKVKDEATEQLKQQIKQKEGNFSSEESKKASEQILGIIIGKQDTVQEKVKKMEELVKKLPDKVKEELHVTNLTNVKSQIESHAQLPIFQVAFNETQSF